MVISPGSRSTPLTLAFAAHPDIHKFVVLDERAAAFRALGIARECGVPTALVCTSGTAVSNYLPALTEAAASGVPLLALTADRPPNQRHIGANQTIQQTDIFGKVAVFSVDCGEPVNNETDFRRLEILGAQAWFTAIKHAGPAHINLPFRKPLEPDADFFKSLPAWYADAQHDRVGAWYTDIESEDFTLPADFMRMLTQARCPVVIAGPTYARTSAAALFEFCSANEIPVLAEPGSGWSPVYGSGTAISGFNAFLRGKSVRTFLLPDLIVRLGAMPTGKGLELYLRDNALVPQILLSAAPELSNPSLSSIMRISVPTGAAIRMPEITGKVRLESDWLQRWSALSKAYLAGRESWFSGKLLPPSGAITNLAAEFPLTDGDVHRLVSRHIPPRVRLMISNSFPARDADTFAMPELSGIRTYMNRGASGIDGITSTAAGIALGSGCETWLVTGDLAFLHDLSGLLNLCAENISLTIIVVNNKGGTIFRMLPVYSDADWYKTYFETPQHADLGLLSTALGAKCVQVATRSALDEALRARGVTGVRVIECRTDANASMQERILANRMFTTEG